MNPVSLIFMIIELAILFGVWIYTMYLIVTRKTEADMESA